MALSSLTGALRRNGRIEDLVILGTKVLEQFLTTWDNEKQRLVLSPRYDPATRRHHFQTYVSASAQRLSFYMVPDHYLIGHGTIAGRTAAFFVDTGLVTRDSKGRQPALLMNAGQLGRFGLGGKNEQQGFVDAPGPIRLGSVELKHQGMLVRPGATGFEFAGIKLDALLAHGFLKHCVWTLDFDTRSWYLRAFRKPPRVALSPSTASKNKRPAKKLPPVKLNQYVGTYKSQAIRSEIKVVVMGQRLVFSATGNLKGKFPLKRTGKHTFEADNAPLKISLTFAVTGNSTTHVAVRVGPQGPFKFKR